ncbi:MAG: type I restriction-modification system subunit M [Proteobacteria bacterium]|jgi:type I restriction enzyme M protein|nr:SAM-dependent DNA methyltransferase [Desulfocapsa sp.]MBU3944480.1 type I restriction-modification system subunit M [Pseudomonadota bacterium]MBU4029711.1 type I restriction-modification system subunit M [Pseudomonadota bacterium]MBU4041829.1 type I restriction-modification system subunit M [Pseudomonadota bacterium]MBU4084171.1 type I restriction-modification system subunit M [Pseudomonadota bacterium]
MALSLNKPKLDNLAGNIWKSAQRLRGKFKPYEYQGVILPIIVIRRLECVLLAWREAKSAEVQAKRPTLTDKELARLVKDLEMNPQQSPFSNKTEWTLRKVYEEDYTLLDENFRVYINGFSKNVDDIIEHFNYRNTITTIVKNNRLAPLLNQYKELELGPDQLSGLEMGYIYEELLRRFSEQSGEEAGEHFTPREVIRLMVELLDIPIPDHHVSIYDPACGTGGMLSVAKEHLLDRAATPAQRSKVEKLVTVHGQELSPTNYAICQADLLIKNDQQAKVFLGNSLIPHEATSREPGDQLAKPDDQFNFMLSNPPFGVTWGGKDGYEKEARKLIKSRYQAGMPRVNDGALLFLQTMLAKMQPPEKGGSRIAIIFNGSPLSNGDCGSGESEIRRWILENDWLDAIVMLPDQLFYNTGIFTYIWLLRNEKPASHRGRVMLIDGRQQFEKEPKAFGNKRNRMTDGHRQWIEERYQQGWKAGFEDEQVKIFQTQDFAFHKVKVVFWQSDADDQPAIITEPYEKAFTTANLSKELKFHDSALTFRVTFSSPRPPGEGPGMRAEQTAEFTLKPTDSVAKKFKEALGDKPEILAVEWTHRHYVQDDEYIPHGEEIEAFLQREIAKPIIRWEDSPQLGYEILPNKYFYRYQPPTPAKELLAEFWRLEKEAEKMLVGLAK